MFGYVCYKHIPDATRRKLDDRSRVMLLIGYHYIGAYKLYCLVTNKVEVSEDVIVRESERWDWSKSQSNYSAMSMLEFDSASDGDFAYKVVLNLKESINLKMTLTLKVSLTLKVTLNLMVDLTLKFT